MGESLERWPLSCSGQLGLPRGLWYKHHNSASPLRNGKQCLQNMKIILAKQLEAVFNYQPSLGSPHASLAESRTDLKDKEPFGSCCICGRWNSVYK